MLNSLRQAGIASAVFLLLSLPQVYSKTNPFVSEQGECPTFKTRLIHFVSYLVLVVLALKYLVKLDRPCPDITGYALYAGLLFFLISSPEMYQLTNSLFGENLKLAEGSCPTFAGVLTHTAVFALCLASWQAYFPKQNIFD